MSQNDIEIQREGEIEIEDGEEICEDFQRDNLYNQLKFADSYEQRACCRSEFELDELMIFPESLHIDYKHYNWPIISPQITKKIAVEILSFLNCSGGALLIGINDQDYKVKGIQLTTKQREEFQKYIDDKILCFIHPIVKNEVKVSFIPIRQGDTWKKNLYVIRVLIQQGKTDEVYTFSSENFEMLASVRRQSSCFILKQEHIKNEIQSRIKFPILKIPPHICKQENFEGIKQSCYVSELEKNHKESIQKNANQENSQICHENTQKIFVQFLQNCNDSINQLIRAISNILTQNSIDFSKISQHKQVIFNILKRKQCKLANQVLSSWQELYNQHHESLIRITFQQQKIFQVDIPSQKVIIFQNIDRAKIQSLKQFLLNEMGDIFILPLEYNFMIQVDDLKEAWNLLNKKRKILTKYSFKNVEVRYGISDNMKIIISNLIDNKESLQNFQKYFEEISVGISCKGEDNNDQVILYFSSFIDYILASERLQFLMYQDHNFRQFGKNQKVYINLEIISK
ncbi:hypothetical protein ABPG72_013270 [Tetrahymena utriculariae]